jgi:aromatic-amino-acid transaminase
LGGILFDHVPSVTGDPILSLQEVYARDERPGKVNLSIGLYYDEIGRVPELSSVRIARDRIQSRYQAGGYQPMAGAANYRRAVQALLFGADHPVVAAGRVATIQTLGGSGALKIGSDLLKTHFPNAEVWISDPSWDNHAGIFEGSGFKIRRYPYFNPDTGGVDFQSMATCLTSLPPQSIVLLHPCCHNPTGADLEQNDWDEIIEIVKDRRLIPFVDIAYQGYGKGVDEDRYLISALADAGVSFLVSNSFSKTFSLYGERCGGLSVVCASAEEAGRVLGQIERVVRRSYSSPPTYGGQIVASVLLDVELKALWVSEVAAMRMRIYEMRHILHETLSRLRPDINFDYVLRQQGMFSFTGLTPEHVRTLRADAGIYLVDSGRLCLTGLNPANVLRVAGEIARVMPS